MSGVCGVVSGTPSSLSEAAVSGMLRSIRHRGPDGSQTFIDSEAGAGLGHVHLNSFAPASRASRCGFLDGEDVVVAVDGGITGHPPASPFAASVGRGNGSTEDLEALRAAYRTAGGRFVSGFDGPFALALWDKEKRELFLSRDKLGEKSLYYYLDPRGETLIFASEIKAILSHPDVQRELDPESVPLYLAFGYLPGPRTLFRGIRKLLPGERLHWDRSHPPRTERYWRLPPGDAVGDETQAIRELRELFLSALESYVGGCDDVAVLLSGGVDSSIIVAALRQLGVPRIHTFTVGFDVDPAGARGREDLLYARKVAERFETDHHEVVIPRGHRLESGLPRVVEQLDDLIMTPNSYSKHLLVEEIRRAGLNSVLTGSAAAGACGVHRKFLDPHKRERLLEKTRGCATNEERYYRLRGRLFDLDEQRRILCSRPRIGKRDILDVLRLYVGEIEMDDFFRLFLFSNLMITSTEKSIKVLDKIGMMSSVEIRSPYLDRKLVEYSARLPGSFDGGRSYVTLKTHLKKAFEPDLPEEVLKREVIGYPSYYWTNGELTGFKKALLDSESLARNRVFDHGGLMRVLAEDESSQAKSKGKKTWAVTQFCLWHEIHINRNRVFC